MSGLSFYCKKNENQNNERLQLSIEMPGEGFCLDNIQCSVIAISKLAGGNALPLSVYKEYKVKFDGLDDKQINQIAHYIKNYSIAKNPLGIHSV